jgi:hypothetical protein
MQIRSQGISLYKSIRTDALLSGLVVSRPEDSTKLEAYLKNNGVLRDDVIVDTMPYLGDAYSQEECLPHMVNSESRRKTITHKSRDKWLREYFATLSDKLPTIFVPAGIYSADESTLQWNISVASQALDELDRIGSIEKAILPVAISKDILSSSHLTDILLSGLSFVPEYRRFYIVPSYDATTPKAALSAIIMENLHSIVAYLKTTGAKVTMGFSGIMHWPVYAMSQTEFTLSPYNITSSFSTYNWVVKPSGGKKALERSFVRELFLKLTQEEIVKIAQIVLNSTHEEIDTVQWINRTNEDGSFVETGRFMASLPSDRAALCEKASVAEAVYRIARKEGGILRPDTGGPFISQWHEFLSKQVRS